MKKLTKIVATISDRRCEVDFLSDLYKAGMNVVRINTAHQIPETAIKIVENVRQVSDKIGILVDTKGPEIRTGKLEGAIPVKTGDKIKVRHDGSDVETNKEILQVNYKDFHKDVPVGSVVLIDDGYLELSVDSKDGDSLLCTIKNDGELKPNKSVNVPDVSIKLPSLTEKDKKFIEWSAQNDIDFIAHSFVRNAQDCIDVQKILDQYNSPAKIIAKIENREGVDNIDEILDHAYGVMVARGDLGIEIPGEEVPLVQKELIRKCIERSAPVITATQMLESMIKNPRATRAEISDVANAIMDETDAIMLSGETAYGDYPVEAVKTMTRIAEYVESKETSVSEIALGRKLPQGKTLSKKVLNFYSAKAAVRSSIDLPVKAIVVPTRTGGTAKNVASFRNSIPTYAACYEHSSIRKLALSFGVRPYGIDLENRTEVIKKSLEAAKEDGAIKDEDLVTIILSTPNSPDGETNLMEINTVKALLETHTGVCVIG